MKRSRKNWRVSTSFSFNRSVHQLRNRNVNAPFPGTALDPALTKEQIDQLRPFYPYVGRINRFESIGNTLGKTLNFTVQIPFKTVPEDTVHRHDSKPASRGQEDDGQWQNPYNIRADWATTTISASGSRAPFRSGLRWWATFNFNFNTNTGRAYTITSGKDDNRDQSINDRPAGVERNSLRGPGQYTVNLTWSSPPINFRKKPKAPAADAAPTGAAGAPTAAAVMSREDQLMQSALAAGLPLATIQQLILAIPAGWCNRYGRSDHADDSAILAASPRDVQSSDPESAQQHENQRLQRRDNIAALWKTHKVWSRQVDPAFVEYAILRHRQKGRAMKRSLCFLACFLFAATAYAQDVDFGAFGDPAACWGPSLLLLAGQHQLVEPQRRPHRRIGSYACATRSRKRKCR